MNKKRFLVGKNLRTRKEIRVSHEDVNQAVQHFKKQGGLIRELPPQSVETRKQVGCRLPSPYEVVLER